MRRVDQWRSQGLRHAADVIETMGDEELLSLVRRLRQPVAYWLRANAEEDEYVPVEFADDDNVNLEPVDWVMRLIIEERNHTLRNVQLGPREVGINGTTERET